MVQSHRYCNPGPKLKKRDLAGLWLPAQPGITTTDFFCSQSTQLHACKPRDATAHESLGRSLAGAPAERNMSFNNVMDFQGICYDVVIKTGPDAGSNKRILHDVTAQCVSGRLTALMGPSGAGKSSLVGWSAKQHPLPLQQTFKGGATAAFHPVSLLHLQQHHN